MHPAFSVLIFTVTSGFGYGLMSLLIVVQMRSAVPIVSSTVYAGAFVLALALITIGLLSSTFHLANKKNAWRAFSQCKTSWLSREGVFAIFFYPVALIYMFILWQSGFVNSSLSIAFGALCIGLSLLLTHCTAMIYASLKTIPQWHSWRVPLVFQLLSIYSGLLLLVCVLRLGEHSVPSAVLYLAAVLGLCIAVLKLEYFSFVGRPARTTINTATSFTEAKVRLFDAGHSAENFLQREFMYEVGPKTKTLARRVVILIAFIVPVCLLLLQSTVSFELAVLSSVLAYFGLLLERWLFFVEAKHVVRRFYGRAE